ncbi:MAG: hypothetical protein ACC608_07020 [Anaerofustis sp.]
MEYRFIGYGGTHMTRCVVSVAKGECSSFCMTVVDRQSAAASAASDLLLMRKSRRKRFSLMRLAACHPYGFDKNSISR